MTLDCFHYYFRNVKVRLWKCLKSSAKHVTVPKNRMPSYCVAHVIDPQLPLPNIYKVTTFVAAVGNILPNKPYTYPQHSRDDVTRTNK